MLQQLNRNPENKTAMEVFQGILEKGMERADLELLIRKIRIVEDHLKIDLQLPEKTQILSQSPKISKKR